MRHRLRVVARSIILLAILAAACTDVDFFQDSNGYITGWHVRLVVVPPIAKKAVRLIMPGDGP